MDNEIKKFCWRCKTEKLVSDYCRDGADSVCKTCRYELNSTWAKANREKLRPQRAAYMRAWRLKKAEEAKTSQAPVVDVPADKDPA